MYKTVVDKERNIGPLTDTTCSGGFSSDEIILVLKILLLLQKFLDST